MGHIQLPCPLDPTETRYAIIGHRILIFSFTRYQPSLLAECDIPFPRTPRFANFGSKICSGTNSIEGCKLKPVESKKGFKCCIVYLYPLYCLDQRFMCVSDDVPSHMLSRSSRKQMKNEYVLLGRTTFVKHNFALNCI